MSSRLLGEWPQIQKPAPEFRGTAVVKGDFKEIKLSDYQGKYVVLFFYPLDLYVSILLNYYSRHVPDTWTICDLYILSTVHLFVQRRS